MKNLFGVCVLLFYATFIHAQSSTTVRSLPQFSKIALSGGYDKVILKAGSQESIELKVSGISPDLITTAVKNGTLEIKMEKEGCYNFKAILTITYANLTAIASSGSSDIEAQDAIKADRFEFASSGSGDFKGEFDVKSLEIAISGSSDMTLKGRANQQDIAISGSGDVNATQLRGDSAVVAISGSGDVKLNVSGKIKTSVSGSGDVSNN
jgi:Putative auto-transporter adhesin, head GIN domain